MTEQRKSRGIPDIQMVLAELRQLRKELRAPNKRLFPIEDAANYLGIASKTIRNGLGPRAKKPFPIKPVRYGGKVLFKREDLDKFVDELTS
jgi:hypothetical protein